MIDGDDSVARFDTRHGTLKRSPPDALLDLPRLASFEMAARDMDSLEKSTHTFIKALGRGGVHCVVPLHVRCFFGNVFFSLPHFCIGDSSSCDSFFFVFTKSSL
jgi:hypothetical protein